MTRTLWRGDATKCSTLWSYREAREKGIQQKENEQQFKPLNVIRYRIN